jgi:hypothetical protein
VCGDWSAESVKIIDNGSPGREDIGADKETRIEPSKKPALGRVFC